MKSLQRQLIEVKKDKENEIQVGPKGTNMYILLSLVEVLSDLLGTLKLNIFINSVAAKK